MRSEPTTIPYYPMFMDEWPPLDVRMRRQRLAQFWRGRRWVKRGQISRIRRRGCITGMVWSEPPGHRDRRLPRPLYRKIHRGAESIIVGFSPRPGRRRLQFMALPPATIRAFNAAMRAFREARYQ